MNVFLTLGGIFGGLSVVLGAFGAHALKRVLSEELQKSFETGVKYQMYHAFILIISSALFQFEREWENLMGWSFVIGIILFSFSIYGLCLSSAKGKKLKFLGPVTPLGGLFLVVGWILFIYNSVDY